MSTRFLSQGGKLVPAIALNAVVFFSLSAAIEPACAGEAAISNFETFTGLSPTAAVVGHLKNPIIIYAIFNGGSDNCGRLVALVSSNGLDFTQTTLHTFTGGSGDGCGPTNLTHDFFSGDITVTSEQGGASNHGMDQVFAPSGNVTSSSDVSNPIGNTTQPISEAPRWRSKSPAGTETVYISTTYQIYESVLSANGTLSTPSLIYTFPSADNHKDGVVLSGPAEFGPDGNLYGATNQGGKGYGVVYKLTPVTVGTTTTWTETVLHTFKGGADGGRPWGQLAIDAAGNLYGTTTMGGVLDRAPTNCNNNGFAGCGVVFEFVYSPTATLWTEKILHAFTGSSDGAIPMAGVVFDAHNNLYGTTFAGGNTNLAACSGAAVGNTTPGCGVVFELTGGSHNKKETVLYSFQGGTDGAEPQGAVTLNGKDIFGTTVAGGDTTDAICDSNEGLGYANGCGVVFEITP
jgi:hypothetical protein